MSLPTIDLDDELLPPPQEVHQVAVNSNVYFRLGKAVATTEGEEDRLEVGPGAVGLAERVQGQLQVLRLPKS